MAVLGSQFWDKLSQISQSAGMDPKDLLAVMYYESGLNPAAHNANGNASGLIQFMPKTLEDLGFQGDHSDFRQLDALHQLDYVAEYVANKAARTGGFKSAAQYYVANLWPVASTLPGVQDEDPNTVIIDSNPEKQRYPGVSLDYERAAYKANRGLDVDHDGKITYGDLETVMNGVKHSQGYQNAVAKLSAGDSISVGGKQNQSAQPPAYNQEVATENAPDEHTLDQLESILNQFSAALASFYPSKHYLTKQAYAKTMLPNPLLIKVESDSFDTSLEFARVLTATIDSELYTDASIYTNNQAVEVECTVYGPRTLSVNSTLQLCDALSEIFEEATQKIGGCKVQTIIVPNKSPNYPELDIKIAQASYIHFHRQFI